MKPCSVTAINAAEAIFCPIFDRYLFDDDTLTPARAECKRSWDGVLVSGGHDFSVTWTGSVSLKGYDKVLLFLTAAPSVTLSASAVIDGAETALFDGVSGDTVPIEALSDPVNADCSDRVMTQITLHFISSVEETMIHLSWFGLQNSQKELLLEQERVLYDFSDRIRPGKAYVENNPYFTAEEAERIKQRLLADPALVESIREDADRWLEFEPEREIREFAPAILHLYRFVRVRDRGRVTLHDILCDLAIAGFLLEDERYSRMAARMILSLVHTKWCEGPICCFPGSEFHHVAFVEDALTAEIVIAMGFLGGIFTEEALCEITEKIREAWKWVKFKCEERCYRRFMNQGVVSNCANILGAYFLQMREGGHEEDIRAAYLTHTDAIEHYLSEDGHCPEGGHYYQYSFATTISVWHIYSRFFGKEMTEVVPKRFRDSSAYLEAILSSRDPKGVYLTIGCGEETEMDLLLAVFLTVFCGFESGNAYLNARMSDPTVGTEGMRKRDSNIGLMFLNFYQEKQGAKTAASVQPKPIVLERDGIAGFPFAGGKLLVTAERNPYTGHFHEDRGGIVLEANGELLLPDLGTTNYSNIATAFMERKEYHNVAYPTDLPMRVASPIALSAAAEAAYPTRSVLTEEDMAWPEAKLTVGDTAEQPFSFCAETGMLFGEGISGKRSGLLDPENCRLTLTEDWSFPQPHPLSVVYLSYAPWEIEGNAVRSCTEHTALSIRFSGQPRFVVDETMIDWAERRVWTLRAEYAQAPGHHVVSEISWDTL